MCPAGQAGVRPPSTLPPPFPIHCTGTQNYGGQSVFSVSPVEGVMEPGQTQDFTVTFSPDHESLYFSDQLRVVLFKKVVARQGLPPSPSLSPLSYLSRWAQGSQKNKGQPDQAV